jgi:tetratricopeptide (TPR) repeat protein
MAEHLAYTLEYLNNGALALFLEGKMTEAIDLLTHAYALFKSYQLQQLPGPNRGSNAIHRPSIPSNFRLVKNDLQAHGRGASLCCNRMPRQEQQEEASCKQSPLHVLERNIASLSSGESTTHSLYNRGLVLSVDCPDGDAILLLTINQHRTAAILLYNMALCYHNMGSHFGVSSALPKALQLYDLALESIDLGTNLMEIQKLLLAILNNKANIYTYFRRIEETQKCFENLKLVLAASTIEMSLDEDYNFFFLNALFQGQELCFAPAA